MLYIRGSCLSRSITSLLCPSSCSPLRSGYDGQRNLSLCYYHFNINTNSILYTHLHSFHSLIIIFMDIIEKYPLFPGSNILFSKQFKMKVWFNMQLFIISEIITKIQLRVKEDRHKFISNAVNS